VGAWGPGVFQNDDAADLRDDWRGLIGVGFDPREVGRRLIDEFGLSENPDHAPSWLALADLLWRAGRLAPDTKRRALTILRDGIALEGWDGAPLRARKRALGELEARLRSPMPAPIRSRPRHPCDWKRGELIAWRTADGGSAVFRVVDFDKSFGGGGSPVVELVGADGPDSTPHPRDIADAQARTVANSLKLTSGQRWRGTRFKIGVFQPGTYNPRRIRRTRPTSLNPHFPRTKIQPIGTRWDGLDGLLLRGFDLPWPRGAILRVPATARPVWLVVADIMTQSGMPATVCEVLAWHERADPVHAALRSLDVHRTDDTVDIVRARVVDPRNRKSIAKMKQHLGVRQIDERVPFRITLLGYAPSGITIVGRRRVAVPTSGSNVADWNDLGTVVDRLVGSDDCRVPMDDVDPAPWG
jgi:hypothetical protein